MRNQRWLLALLAIALVPASVLAQQTGTVIGQVTAQETDEPLSGVAIMVQGTALGTLTNAEGQYRLTRVPAGEQQVVATLVGRDAPAQTVVVPAGGTVTADFVMRTSAIALEGIVVSATGVDQRQRELGNSVAQVQVEDVELSTVTSVPDLLQGRAAGVTVLQSSGTSGTGARIRIRGNNSISLSNEPLVIIDGVRATSNPNAADILGGQSTSRFNDFSPSEIESIEVLKGPAASALYGTAAANGVILITTKTGRAGETRFNAWTEQGTIIEDNDYPSNFAQLGSSLVPLQASDGSTLPVGTTIFCEIPVQTEGICEPTDLLSFNPLEVNSPFQDGRLRTYGMSVAGGAEQVQYYVSAETSDEEGIYSINEVDQLNLRANVDAQLRDNLSLGVKAGYISNDARLPYNDNAVEGIVSSGLLGSFEENANGGYFAYPLENRFAFDNQQGVERFIGSAQARLVPLPWLAINGMAGLDLLTESTFQTLRPGVFTPAIDEDYAIGYRFATRDVVRGINTNLSATAEFDLTPDLFSTTIVGGQFIQDNLQSVSAGGYGLLPGTETLGSLSERFEVGETNLETRTVGAYISQQLAWRDRAFLTAALRGDDNSAFGNDFGLALYPSVSASWVVAEEPWFPVVDFLSTLRLRAAYGESGLQPGFRTGRQFFSPVTATLQGDVSVPAITIGGAGNPELEPEESREFEFGFDAGLLEDQLGLEFTYYNKQSENALVSRPLPPSLGSAGSQTINIGGVSNSGFEALLNANIVERENFIWDATLSYATNDNEVEDLGLDVTGEPLPPIIFGLGTNTQRHQEGFPVGAYFQRTIEDFEDANGDGVIALSEIEFSEAPEFQGTPFPTREAAFSTSLTLFGWMELSALVDHRGGHKLYNATEEFRCSTLVICEGINDPEASLADQAAAVAAYEGVSVAGFFEDADYTKLRNVSLRLFAPRDWAQRVGASMLSVTLSGRNLATWTDYSGLDPEINSAGQSGSSTFDFLGQPPVKHYTLRLDVGF